MKRPPPPPDAGGAKISFPSFRKEGLGEVLILTLRSSRIGRWGGSVLLLLALVLLTGASPTKPHDTLAISSPMPEFALPTVDGAIVQSPGFRGRTLVLNFCAFWCDTWKAEWPSLTELAQEQNNSDFQLVMVSVDGTRVPQFHRGLEQLQKHDGVPPFPVLLDAGERVSILYKIAHVPTVVVIDASGRIRYVTEGYPGNAVVLHQVRTLQNERPPKG